MTMLIKGIYIGKTRVSMDIDKDGIYTVILSRNNGDYYSISKKYQSANRKSAMNAFYRFRREATA